MRELERITARRGELDTLAEELAKQLQVQAEREELIIVERVLHRRAEQDRAAEQDAAAFAPTPAWVAGRAVLLIPHRSEAEDEAALPDDYRTILATAYRAELSARVDQPVLFDDPVLQRDLQLPDSWWEDLAGTLERVGAVDTDRVAVRQQYMGRAIPEFVGIPARP
ncbi:hypothetical protein ACFZB2_36270 [Streptomyces bobili]|uniref:hypothetical protein n=1 Tax=Streptomyces bobili TaxID=67280 RepID=UPI0036E7FB8D